MQHLEVSGAVRPIYESLGVKRLKKRLDKEGLELRTASRWFRIPLVSGFVKKKGDENSGSLQWIQGLPHQLSDDQVLKEAL